MELLIMARVDKIVSKASDGKRNRMKVLSGHFCLLASADCVLQYWQPTVTGSTSNHFLP